MKRFLIISLAVLMLLCSCSPATVNDPEGGTTPDTVQQNDSAADSLPLDPNENELSREKLGGLDENQELSVRIIAKAKTEQILEDLLDLTDDQKTRSAEEKAAWEAEVARINGLYNSTLDRKLGYMAEKVNEAEIALMDKYGIAPSGDLHLGKYDVRIDFASVTVKNLLTMLDDEEVTSIIPTSELSSRLSVTAIDESVRDKLCLTDGSNDNREIVAYLEGRVLNDRITVMLTLTNLDKTDESVQALISRLGELSGKSVSFDDLANPVDIPVSGVLELAANEIVKGISLFHSASELNSPSGNFN